jgi:hypothetical protein
MIKTEIDLSQLDQLKNKILSFEENDTLLRTVSFGIYALMKTRIHDSGIKSDGTNIGTYSPGYLDWRLKNNYAAQGNTVKLFLTGQMQNDFSVGKYDKTSYAIGFQNKINYDKSINAEDGQQPHSVKAHTRKIKNPKPGGKNTVAVRSYQSKGWSGYGKIYDLTDDEKKALNKIVTSFLDNLFNSK